MDERRGKEMEKEVIQLTRDEGGRSRRIKRTRAYYSPNQSNIRQSNKW